VVNWLAAPVSSAPSKVALFLRLRNSLSVIVSAVSKAAKAKVSNLLRSNRFPLRTEVLSPAVNRLVVALVDMTTKIRRPDIWPTERSA
jgi:hypothetical protein